MAPVFAVAILLLAILPEERHLEARFGEEYLDYKAPHAALVLNKAVGHGTRRTRGGAGVPGGTASPHGPQPCRLDGGDHGAGLYGQKPDHRLAAPARVFPFARASWLERIHSNGGRPIYEHATPRKPEAEPPAAPAKPARKPEVQKPLSTDEAALYEKLLAAGKGYRPLYLMLEAEMRKAFPDLLVLPKASYLSIGAPKEFAAVTLHAAEVRLGLDLGDRPFDPHLQKSRLKGPRFGHHPHGGPDRCAAGGWCPAGAGGGR